MERQLQRRSLRLGRYVDNQIINGLTGTLPLGKAAADHVWHYCVGRSGNEDVGLIQTIIVVAPIELKGVAVRSHAIGKAVGPSGNHRFPVAIGQRQPLDAAEEGVLVLGIAPVETPKIFIDRQPGDQEVDAKAGIIFQQRHQIAAVGVDAADEPIVLHARTLRALDKVERPLLRCKVDPDRISQPAGDGDDITAVQPGALNRAGGEIGPVEPALRLVQGDAERVSQAAEDRLRVRAIQVRPLDAFVDGVDPVELAAKRVNRQITGAGAGAGGDNRLHTASIRAAGHRRPQNFTPLVRPEEIVRRGGAAGGRGGKRGWRRRRDRGIGSGGGRRRHQGSIGVGQRQLGFNLRPGQAKLGCAIVADHREGAGEIVFQDGAQHITIDPVEAIGANVERRAGVAGAVDQDRLAVAIAPNAVDDQRAFNAVVDGVGMGVHRQLIHLDIAQNLGRIGAGEAGAHEAPRTIPPVDLIAQGVDRHRADAGQVVDNGRLAVAVEVDALDGITRPKVEMVVLHIQGQFGRPRAGIIGVDGRQPGAVEANAVDGADAVLPNWQGAEVDIAVERIRYHTHDACVGEGQMADHPFPTGGATVGLDAVELIVIAPVEIAGRIGGWGRRGKDQHLVKGDAVIGRLQFATVAANAGRSGGQGAARAGADLHLHGQTLLGGVGQLRQRTGDLRRPTAATGGRTAASNKGGAGGDIHDNRHIAGAERAIVAHRQWVVDRRAGDAGANVAPPAQFQVNREQVAGIFGKARHTGNRRVANDVEGRFCCKEANRIGSQINLADDIDFRAVGIARIRCRFRTHLQNAKEGDAVGVRRVDRHRRTACGGDVEETIPSRRAVAQIEALRPVEAALVLRERQLDDHDIIQRGEIDQDLGVRPVGIHHPDLGIMRGDQEITGVEPVNGIEVDLAIGAIHHDAADAIGGRVGAGG